MKKRREKSIPGEILSKKNLFEISNKKAQFYIIAAVIIVIVIFGIVGISNYVVVKESPVGFYDLSENLGFEGANVIDYGIYRSANMDKLIKSFAEDYSAYAASTGENFELAIIYGNKNDAKIITNFTVQSSGSMSLGEFGQPIAGTVTSTVTPIVKGDEKVNVSIANNTYNFELKENENFFFVIAKSQGFEKYVQEKGAN